jgi:hypothetical protein
MRSIVAGLAFAAFLPSAALAATTLAFGPGTSAPNVTYRFTATMERPQSAFQDPSDATSPPPPRVDTQTIAFAAIDASHVQLTVVDPTVAKPDTLVVERAPDGTLQAKLKRGNHWALPIALYNRVVSIAASAATLKSGASVPAKLAPITSNDTIDGKLTATQSKDTLRVAFDGTGDVTPSRELLSGGPPGGGPNGGGPNGPGGGGFGGFGGRGGGHHGGQFGGSGRKAGATVDATALFQNDAFQRADSTESLEIGDQGATAKQTWTVERVPG